MSDAARDHVRWQLDGWRARGRPRLVNRDAVVEEAFLEMYLLPGIDHVHPDAVRAILERAVAQARFDARWDAVRENVLASLGASADTDRGVA